MGEAVAKQFASRLSLIAFSTASLRGLLCGADFEGTMRTALIVTAVFYGLGLILGDLARRVVEENVELEVQRMLSEKSEAGS